MVESGTSYSGNGLRDWLVQRVTAVILAVYFIFLGIYFIQHQGLNYSDWHNLFSHNGMKVATLLALGSLVLHAWVGMWTVLTDYVKWFKTRLFLQISVILILLGYFTYGIITLWSF